MGPITCGISCSKPYTMYMNMIVGNKVGLTKGRGAEGGSNSRGENRDNFLFRTVFIHNASS